MEKKNDQRRNQPVEEKVTKAQALAPERAFMVVIDRQSSDDADDIDAGWQTKALCAQVDHDSFFPERGGSVYLAKKVCGMCEVRSACLEFALENDIDDGVWGGLSYNERQQELQRRTRQAS